LNRNRTATVALGVLAGLLGASHGLGEILQGNVAPSSIIINAWPEFAAYGGVPAMTVVPNFNSNRSLSHNFRTHGCIVDGCVC
jgi:hypothetical protein